MNTSPLTAPSILWAFIDADPDDRPECDVLDCTNRARVLTYHQESGEADALCLVCARQGRAFNRHVRRLEEARRGRR